MTIGTICVVGLGYIGLPTAAMFASKGRMVIGVDVNRHIVDTINAGRIHIVEPELDAMVKKAVGEGLLTAFITPQPADAFLIAVPTPFLPLESKGSIPEPDLRYIEAASKSIAKVLKKGDLVVLESTSPVGTTEQLERWLAEARPDLTFPQTHGEESQIRVAYCPERVLPGHVIQELVKNDRVVGGLTEVCAAAAVELYGTFVKGRCVLTNARTAEMVKLSENAARDVGIALANELSIICDKLDIDVWELIALANHHPRVNILQPGPGVGGHCIAVDPWFIVSKVPEESKLIRAARKVNDYKPQWVINKVKLAVADYLLLHPTKTIKNVTLACFGLAFKPNIDDLRSSPALYITSKLADFNFGKLLAVEPNIVALPESIGAGVELATVSIALEQADICVLLVDHDEFKSIDSTLLEALIVIDTKGIWIS
jgi:UDP-N-acetyl-D-mannosaminuronic acid dehydrogenase